MIKRKDIFKFFGIIQEKQFKDDEGYLYKKRRVNPFNPLSYIFIIILIVISVFLFGIVKLIEENENPFLWQ
jgi:hypothetical protein